MTESEEKEGTGATTDGNFKDACISKGETRQIIKKSLSDEFSFLDDYPSVCLSCLRRLFSFTWRAFARQRLQRCEEPNEIFMLSSRNCAISIVLDRYTIIIHSWYSFFFLFLPWNPTSIVPACSPIGSGDPSILQLHLRRSCTLLWERMDTTIFIATCRLLLARITEKCYEKDDTEIDLRGGIKKNRTEGKIRRAMQHFKIIQSVSDGDSTKNKFSRGISHPFSPFWDTL